MDDNMDLPYRKRHRVPASCSVCRKRKSKCDRIRPVCGTCKKKSIAHLCFYEQGNDDPHDYTLNTTYLPQPSMIPLQTPLSPNGNPPQSEESTNYQQSTNYGNRSIPTPGTYEGDSYVASIQPGQPGQPGPIPAPMQPMQHGSIPYIPPPQIYVRSGYEKPPQFHNQPYPMQSHYQEHQVEQGQVQQPQVYYNQQVHQPQQVYQQSHQQMHQQHHQPHQNQNQNQPQLQPQQVHQRAHQLPPQQPPQQPSQQPQQPPQLPPQLPLQQQPQPPQLPLQQQPQPPQLPLQQQPQPPQLPPQQPPQLPPQPPPQQPSSAQLTSYIPPAQIPSPASGYHISPGANQLKQNSPFTQLPVLQNFQPPLGQQVSPPSKRYSFSNASPNSNYESRTSLGGHGGMPFSIPNTAMSSSISNSSIRSSKSNNEFSPTAPTQSASFSSTPLVTIPLGPNSTLHVNPYDSINVFTNASFSLNLEGPLWQQQGTLSYVGLTKSDPFIKILRNFAILLFRSGEMTQFIKMETLKQKKNSGSPLSASSSTNEVSPLDFKRRRKYDSPTSQDIEKKDVDGEPGDVVDEDALIVERIKMNTNNNSNEEDDDEEDEVPQMLDLNEGPLNTDKADNKDTPTSSVSVNSTMGVNMSDQDSVCSSSTSPHRNKHRTKSNLSILNILPGLHSIYSGKKNRSQFYAIVEKAVLQILPSRINAFVLFCNFFKHVFPFIPIVDENSLLMDISTILPTFSLTSTESYSEISIDSENDLSIMGIFLLVIRLGYLSMIHNDEANNGCNDREKSIIKEMSRVSSETFTSVLTLCISDKLIAEKSSFKLVQCLTLLYFYRKVVPDDCHGLGGADSQVLFGSVMKHAMSIGMNRDPTFYVAHEAISKRESLIKIWRSLWNFLITYDATSAMHCGTNLVLMNLDICDVQMPQVEDKSGQMIHTLENIRVICDSYRNIVNKINNVKNKPKVIDILYETNHLERVFFNFFGKDFFKESICERAKEPPSFSGFSITSKEHQEGYIKVIKYCTFIQLRTNLTGMYYMVAIHYENEHNESKTSSMNAGIELFKIYIKSVVQLVYIMSYVLDNSVELFGRNYDYFLTSSNERCMIKTHSFLTSFFVRLLHHKKGLSLRLPREPILKPRLEVIDTLFNVVLFEAELFVGNFRKLSRNYINSYKLYVMTYFVLKQCTENPSVFFERTVNDERFSHEGTNMLEFFTTYELQYLCKLCEDFRAAKEQQQKIKFKEPASIPRTTPSGAPFHLPFPDTNSKKPHSHTRSGSSHSSSSMISPSTSQTSERPKPSQIQKPVSPPGPGTKLHKNSNDGVFDNLNVGNEELLKLFEVYGDFNNDEF